MIRPSVCQPWLMPMLIMCSDILAVFLSATLCVVGRHMLGGQFDLAFYGKLWPLVFLFPLSYAALGAYKVLMPLPMELKRCTLGTCFMFLFLAAFTFWSRTAHEYSRLVLSCSCLLACIAVPFFRRKVRALLSDVEGWRLPAIILGEGDVAHSMIDNLREHLCLGLVPVAVVSDRGASENRCRGVEQYAFADIPSLAAKYPCGYFIIAKPSLSLIQYQNILKKINMHFSKVVIAPDIFRPASMWATVVDMNGILGLETDQKLLAPLPSFCKRAIDYLGSLIGLIFLTPFFILIILAIKIDSTGPVFYFQERVGRHGERFKLWKFRTMVKNAKEVLEEYIESDPEAKKQWEEEHKLTDDPRITRVGGFLRKWSVDELPQLINVFIGDMSLVGPRPIVEAEIEKYSNNFELYSKVFPGMTGLWQVSGRSSLSYSKRIQLDLYYIRNWSIWFDLYILTRTPGAVFRRDGAV